jgi:hypothetical protein
MTTILVALLPVLVVLACAAPGFIRLRRERQRHREELARFHAVGGAAVEAAKKGRP